MNIRGAKRPKTSDVTSIINVKILLHECSTKAQCYYTVSVGTKRPAHCLKVRHVLGNQTGHYMITNLIEALTQDAVLEAISPLQKKVSM